MTDMSFKHYLKENTKTYSYVIKLALPEVSEECVDKLIAALQKYELVKADKFASTPPQATPFDFPQLKNMPVHRSMIEIKYPASTEFLQHLVSQTLGMTNACVVVQNEADPRIKDVSQYLERNMPEYAKNYVSRLGNDNYANEESSALNLADQVKSVMDPANRTSPECTVVTNSLVPDQKVELPPAEYNKMPTEQTGLSLFGKTIR